MEWFEDDDFWRELYPYMFPPERIAAAAGEVADIIALTNVTGRSVLDLCCGPGRHSVEFAKSGFQVTGVDRTQYLLDLARQRAGQAGVQVEWVLGDMRNFRRPAAFHLACSLFTSFGYFDTPDQDLAVLGNVLDSLKPGGVFVLEMLGKERLARVFEDSTCTGLPDGSLLLQRHEIRDDWSRVANTWTLLKDGRYRSFRFEHTIYSGRELKERLLQCGFADVLLFGDLKASPYGLNANRLVAIARKRV